MVTLKNIVYMHAIKKIQKGNRVEIQNDFQNMFNIYNLKIEGKI